VILMVTLLVFRRYGTYAKYDRIRPLQNLIHPVEFPLCGTPFGGFHRAGFCHPKEEKPILFKEI